MKGNSIVLSVPEKGHRKEGIASEAGIKPGHLLEIVPGTSLDDSGRYSVRLWDGSATGVRGTICVADIGFSGGTYDTAYTNGDRVRLYFPLPGEELNVRVKSGVTTTVGMKLILEKNTGFILETTGTPESEPFVALEGVASTGGCVHVETTGV